MEHRHPAEFFQSGCAGFGRVKLCTEAVQQVPWLALGKLRHPFLRRPEERHKLR
jgi:hypothetical protein